jgi:hypothetical protein
VGVEGSYSKNISLDLHVQKRKSVVENVLTDVNKNEKKTVWKGFTIFQKCYKRQKVYVSSLQIPASEDGPRTFQRKYIARAI